MVTRTPLGNLNIEELCAAGQAAFEDSRFQEATEHFKAALQVKPLSAEDEAIISCQLCAVLERRALKREYIEIISKYETPAELLKLSEQTHVQVLICLGWYRYYKYDTPGSLAIFNQAMRSAHNLDYYAGIGECYMGLGFVYHRFSEFSIARDAYLSAIEWFRRSGNLRRLAECHACICMIDVGEGDYRTAIDSYMQALAIVGEDREHYLFRNCDLASIYIRLDISLDKAITSCERRIRYFRKAGNTFELALSYNNLACELTWLGEWNRAEYLLKSAIEMVRYPTRFNYLAIALDSLAGLYLLQGKLDEADQLLEESLLATSEIKGGKQRDYYVEVSIHLTIGRGFLIKGRIDLALNNLKRALSIAVKLVAHIFLSETRLWLAEALLQDNQIEQACEMIEKVRSDSREESDMHVWGLMMRMVAKLEAARGHATAALQSLAQSSSFFELRGCKYDRAVNHMVLARLLEKKGAINEAIRETESALAVFDSLGAAIDIRNSMTYLESLKKQPSPDKEPPRSFVSPNHPPDLEPLSMTHGFIAQRLAQASVSRNLLLYELASIAREHSRSRAAIIVETREDTFKVATSIDLDEWEKSSLLEFLSSLPGEKYPRHNVYPFTDNHGAGFLLHLIDPQSHVFTQGAAYLRPMLSVVELGLEANSHRSQKRKVQVFDPARLLAQVEMPGFICASRAMSEVLELVHKIRSSDVTVLITGESGTGKELIARAIHAGSARRFRLFLPFNCSSAPRDLIESQLFGYRKGAFTSAVSDYEGVIRAAERGTLLLDEIGDLPLDLQPKLLRFLQEGEIHPLGNSQPLHVDVRVIAATNSDLEQAISNGKFREDLYHRLNVIRVRVPPLRERREEIPVLLSHYLDLYQEEAAKSDIKLSEEVVDLMVVYDWPGNVRELCNEIRRIVAYSDSGAIVTGDVLSSKIARVKRELNTTGSSTGKSSEPLIEPVAEKTLAEATSELEYQMIHKALRRSSGNIAQAARELGLTRRGLYMKMDRLKFKT